MTHHEPEKQTVSVHGAPTAYLEAGQPSAPTMVLLHDGAYGSDAASCWASILEPLSERFHILAPDLLGHGGSPKLVRFDMDPMTQRLWHIGGFCEALEVEQAVFVGSSFGGGMILHAGVRRNLPMRAGVSICGPGGVFMNAERFAALQGYEPSMDNARELCGLMEMAPSEDVVRQRYEATLQPGHWEALSAARLKNPADETEPFDWRPVFKQNLGGVEAPMLLIAGDQDVLLEEGWEEQMASLIPGARSVEIEGARHIPHLDAPDEVVAAVLEFVDGL